MKVHILHLSSTPRGLGGVEMLLAEMAGRFDRSRYDVSFCNLFDETGGSGPFPSALRARGAKQLHVPGARYHQLPAIVLGVAGLLRRERVTILHTHMMHATIVGMLAAPLGRVPIRIVTRHYGDMYGHHWRAVRVLDYLSARSADHVIAVSTAVQDLMRSSGVSDEKITLIHNGIDTGALHDTGDSASLPWPDSWAEKLLIGYVGNLNPWKRHVDLLEAMAQVTRTRTDVKLVFIGEGPEEGALRARAEELGISEHVCFAGYQRRVAKLLPHFDLYVHPSRSEAFGLAIVEAMLAGLPVIAVGVEGVFDIVVEGDTGVLVPPCAPGRLAGALLQLLADPVLLQKMGVRGRERAMEKFSLAQTVQAYQGLYDRLATPVRSH